MDSDEIIFFSYSRDDSKFVLDLAKNLRKAGAIIWLDQLDISVGTRWDTSIQSALSGSKTLLVILSSSSVKSDNVMDEVSYALEEHKIIVPVLLEQCDIPFRLRRFQYADFSGDYNVGIASLIKALNLERHIAIKLVDVATENSNEDSKPITSFMSEEKSGNKVKVALAELNVKAASQKDSHTNSSKITEQKKPKRWLYGSILIGVALIIFLTIVLSNSEKNNQRNEDKNNIVVADTSRRKTQNKDENTSAENAEGDNTNGMNSVLENKNNQSRELNDDMKSLVKSNHFQVSKVVNASNVRKVEHSSGIFEQISATGWVESSTRITDKFNFTELKRDEGSVYLIDKSRNITIKLDLEDSKIYIDFMNPNGGRAIYDITRIKK